MIRPNEQTLCCYVYASCCRIPLPVNQGDPLVGGKKLCRTSVSGIHDFSPPNIYRNQTPVTITPSQLFRRHPYTLPSQEVSVDGTTVLRKSGELWFGLRGSASSYELRITEEGIVICRQGKFEWIVKAEDISSKLSSSSPPHRIYNRPSLGCFQPVRERALPRLFTFL